MFGADRSRLRMFYHATWNKRLRGETLEPLEALVADVIALHPEYLDLLTDVGSVNEEFDGPNPYLHMGMHIALHEQIRSARPSGIANLYKRIVRRTGDRHLAEHAMMECLRDALLDAQQRGGELDEAAERQYVSALKRLVRG